MKKRSGSQQANRSVTVYADCSQKADNSDSMRTAGAIGPDVDGIGFSPALAAFVACGCDSDLIKLMNMNMAAALIEAAAAVHGFVFPHITLGNGYILGMGAGAGYGKTCTNSCTKKDHSRNKSNKLFHRQDLPIKINMTLSTTHRAYTKKHALTTQAAQLVRLPALLE